MKQVWRSLFWIWGPLGVLSGALAIVSVIVNSLGIQLAAAPEGVLWLYRQTIDRLFQFSIEWWAGLIWPDFSIADPIKDLIAIYFLMVAVIARDGVIQSRSANLEVDNNVANQLAMKSLRPPSRMSAFGKALFAPEFYWRTTDRLIEQLRWNFVVNNRDSEIAAEYRRRERQDIMLQFSFMYLPLFGSVMFFVWNGFLLRAP